MKKFSFLFFSLLIAFGSFAQCVVDSNLAVLDTTTGGFYPDANHIPHIIQDSAYLQTVQGKIASSMTQTINNVPTFGTVTITVTVDTVSLDSIGGLPTGITWTKSSDILLGGGIGCVQFSGSTTDSAGVYRLSAYGFIKIHYSVEGGLFQGNDSTYGSLERLPAYSNIFLVVDSAPSALSATVTSRTNCSNAPGSATVTPSGGSPVAPYTYLWNTGVTSYTINNVSPGTYYVTVTSGVDTLTDSVAVSGDLTPITATTTSVSPDSNSTQTIGAATINVSGGTPPYTYRWNNGDSTASISGLAPGTYRVRRTDSLGCGIRDSVVIVNLTAGIATLNQLDAKVGLYPNPAADVLHVMIQSPVALNARIEALDITGKVVYTEPANIPSGNSSQVIDVKSFSPGIYILQLTSGVQSLHQRFVVTR